VTTDEIETLELFHYNAAAREGVERTKAAMRFEELPVKGAFAIASDATFDERGTFFRTFCATEFGLRGLDTSFAQHSIAMNARQGTVRGLHYQCAPHAETKLVRCLAGRVFDVIVDLREHSSTCGRWCSIELSADLRNALYVPAGCAHGYQTLSDSCDIQYLITPAYEPSASRGVRWDDPTLRIDWPICESIILSERDRQLPSFEEAMRAMTATPGKMG